MRQVGARLRGQPDLGKDSIGEMLSCWHQWGFTCKVSLRKVFEASEARHCAAQGPPVPVQPAYDPGSVGGGSYDLSLPEAMPAQLGAAGREL